MLQNSLLPLQYHKDEDVAFIYYENEMWLLSLNDTKAQDVKTLRRKFYSAIKTFSAWKIFDQKKYR